MNKIRFLALVMAMALVGAPVFAAVDGENDFAAMTAMPSDVTPLSDDQLAQVEGGFHVGDVDTLLGMADNYVLAGNFAVAQLLQISAGFILITTPPHP